jgi:dihydrofolate synthase/folylpolyglutamate synthase
MTQISNFAEANDALQPYIDQVKVLTGRDTTFDRVGPLMERVGNPHELLKIIHVAGTSGKTSTCYFLADMLKSSGVMTGLTVSPHVDVITERVQINGMPLSEAEFCQNLSEFLELVGDVRPLSSYFELIYVFAFWEFVRHGVEYAVVETGMGGLYDATNIARQRNKVCVITDIGYDHMHLLGHTLPEIAAQKAGIIHEGNDVFLYTQSEEVMRAVHERVAAKGATLHELNEADEAQKIEVLIDALPLFQRRNWLLAKQVYEHVAERDGLQELSNEQFAMTQAIIVPARMQAVQLGGKSCIMDGAHNPQKMQALVESYQAQYSGQKATVVLALKDSKEYKDVVDILLPITAK